MISPNSVRRYRVFELGASLGMVEILAFQACSYDHAAA
jgi:predicted nicotinamide N-methyase